MNQIGRFDSFIFLNVIDILLKNPSKTHINNTNNVVNKRKTNQNYLFVGTSGTQCLATFAPFPFSTSTDLKQVKQKFSYTVPTADINLFFKQNTYIRFTQLEAVISMNHPNNHRFPQV